MSVLQVNNVPDELLERIRLRARTERRTLEEEVVLLLQRALDEMRRREDVSSVLSSIDRHRIKLPPGSPDSVELLRADRDR
ncbi:MAG: hypothetical protein HY291_04225 [Planctomycetes bacterium]|nr:hypothetical protein [Planctomycetota bacterium]